MGRWWSGAAAGAVGAATVAVVLLDLLDERVRAWGTGHALTSSTVTGLLVLLVTVLIVDQVVDRRQARDRSRAVATQGAIVLGQAIRSIRSVDATVRGEGAREDAEHDIRTYMLMLLQSGPLLIDSAPARAFLEQAQALGVRMGFLLADDAGAAVTSEQLADAEQRLRRAAEPLLATLHPDERAAVAAPVADGT